MLMRIPPRSSRRSAGVDLRIPRVPDDRRPVVTATLVAAVIMAAALNCAILDSYGKLYWSYPAELAAGVWKYGLCLLAEERPIEPVTLRADAGRRSY